MGIIKPSQVKTPNGQLIEANLAECLSIVRTPSKREEILQGQFHKVAAPDGQGKITIEKAFLYTDLDRNEVILVKPLSERYTWEETSTELERIVKQLPNNISPPETRFMRVVFGLEELREKLLTREMGIDDRALELFKVLLAYEHPIILKQPRLNVNLHTINEQWLTFIATYEHDKIAYELSMPRQLVDDLLSQPEPLKQWVANSHKDNLFELEKKENPDYWVNFRRWSPTETSLKQLFEYAEQARQNQEIDTTSTDFQTMLKGLPSGNHMPSWAKQALRDLFVWAKDRRNGELQDRLFELRFNKELEDEWYLNDDLNDIDTLWKLLKNLPDTNVEGNTRLDRIELTDGGGGSWNGSTIKIGSQVLRDQEGFEDVMRHEVGHAVQTKIDQAKNNLVTKWLQEQFGWQTFGLDDLEIDAWVNLMGGYGNITAQQQQEVRQYLRDSIGPGGKWEPPQQPPNVPNGHPWYASNFGPRLACEQTGKDWYNRYHRWYRANGLAFFLNYYYRTFIVVKESTLNLLEDDILIPYAAMSPGEFFAELYQVFYNLKDLKWGKIPRPVRDWLWDNIGPPMPIPGKYYTLRNKQSRQVLEVSGASQDNGADVIQSIEHDGYNQRWLLEDMGNGYYTLTAKHSSRALNVEGASTQVGTQIEQYEKNATDAQQWKLEETEDGYCILISKASGMALTVSGNEAKQGALIQQDRNQGSDIQNWRFELVEQISGQVNFYTTDGNGNISLLTKDAGFRKTWQLIIPGNFSGNTFTDLLFYDPTVGEAKFYTTDGNGNISLLKKDTGFRKTWQLIIPGNFSDNTFTDLLFYDPRVGEVSFYTTDGNGNISLLKKYTGFRKTWQLIIPGNFGDNNFTDLLFYDPTVGEAKFYTTDGNGNISLLKKYTGFRKTWQLIIPGNFSGNTFTDLLFYDPTVGEVEFYTTDGNGNISLLKKYTGFRKTWQLIIPGNFGGNTFTDLLFYDRMDSLTFNNTQTDDEIQQIVLFLTNSVVFEGDGKFFTVPGHLPLSYYSTNNYWGDYVCNIWSSKNGGNCQVFVKDQPGEYYYRNGKGSPGEQLQLERVNAKLGTNIYDAACWQIALALAANNRLSGFDPEQLFKLVVNSTKRLNPETPNIRANQNSFKYGYQHEITEPEKAYALRLVGQDYWAQDPFWNDSKYGDFVTFAPNITDKIGSITWPDWKPITGENAWGFFIGPLQSDYLQYYLNQGYIPFNSESIQNALYVLYAFERMQCSIGAFYYAPGGSQGNTEPIPRGEISVENNLSCLSGFIIFKQVLEDTLRLDGLLTGNDKEKINAAINLISIMIWGGTTSNDQTDGLLKFFETKAWNTTDNILYQGGTFDNNTWKPTVEPKAVDVITWGLAVLGPKTFDRWFGEGTAFASWENLKQWGSFSQNGELWGVGYSNVDNHSIMSAEWTAGAITAVRCLMVYHQNDQTKFNSLQADHDVMIANLLNLRSDKYVSMGSNFPEALEAEHFNYVKPPAGELAFLYASKRYYIPFGWYANPIPSTTSTSWAVYLHYDYNPFQLGGSYESLDWTKPRVVPQRSVEMI